VAEVASAKVIDTVDAIASAFASAGMAILELTDGGFAVLAEIQYVSKVTTALILFVGAQSATTVP
jgi:hypothetical protein